MALSRELSDTVKSISEELKLDEQFQQIFLKYLQSESNFQADDEERLETIALLRIALNKDQNGTENN